MKTLPDKRIDLIIADPPYNIGKNYGNKSDMQSKEEYIKFLKSFVVESSRILKNNGSILIYTGK